MEMQEQAITKTSLGAALNAVIPLEDTPADMQALLDQLENIEFCREVALEMSSQRVRRLLSNTANQTSV